MEDFCHSFLMRHSDYRQLYLLIDNYQTNYQKIDTLRIFDSKEAFSERFPIICSTLLALKECREKDQYGRVLAFLGYALFVHELASEMESNWYDIEIMVNTMKYILNYTGFNPLYYCERQENDYSCHILY